MYNYTNYFFSFWIKLPYNDLLVSVLLGKIDYLTKGKWIKVEYTGSLVAKNLLRMLGYLGIKNIRIFLVFLTSTTLRALDILHTYF